MTTSVFPAGYISGVHHVGEVFVYVTFSFKSNHRGSHIPGLWMVHAGCVFVAFTHLGHECQDLWSPCDGMHVSTD